MGRSSGELSEVGGMGGWAEWWGGTLAEVSANEVTGIDLELTMDNKQ